MTPIGVSYCGAQACFKKLFRIIDKPEIKVCDLIERGLVSRIRPLNHGGNWCDLCGMMDDNMDHPRFHAEQLGLVDLEERSKDSRVLGEAFRRAMDRQDGYDTADDDGMSLCIPRS